jgi:DNA topoisomerase-1
MRGPYGYYVQLGPTDPDAETKPKRAAWPKSVPVATAELDTALKLLSLPRQLGAHPETGKAVEANIGPFGPYVKHDGAFKSIPKAENIHEISLQRAVELLAAPRSERGAGGKQLGMHPEDQKPVTLMSGRYGPYVKHGRINATVPRDYEPATLTLEQGLEILAAKSAKSPSTEKTSKGTRTRATTTKRPSRAQPEQAAPAAAAAAKRASRVATKKKAPARAPAKRRRD